MSEKTENIKTLIESLTPSELQDLRSYLRSKLPKHPLEEKWGIPYELVLTAIHRSQDIVQRGVRGVIAEAVFQESVVPTIRGWYAVPVIGDLPYDFLLKQQVGEISVKVQVKLQRMRKGEPDVMPRIYPGTTYKVEVQKTRSGKKKKKKEDHAEIVGLSDAEANESIQTRPYQFGNFDILAVNMQPSTKDWGRFMYSVASWLIPRQKRDEKHLIKIMQPVSLVRTDVWTDNIEECIEWLLSGEKRMVFDLEAATQRNAADRDIAKQRKIAEREIARKKKLAERAAKRTERDKN